MNKTSTSSTNVSVTFLAVGWLCSYLGTWLDNYITCFEQICLCQNCVCSCRSTCSTVWEKWILDQILHGRLHDKLNQCHQQALTHVSKLMGG